MKLLASYSKPEEAHLAVCQLEGHGIEAHLRDEHTVNLYWLYSNAIGGVKFEVAEEDYEQAHAVLELSKKSPGLLSCPHCHSDRVHIREMNLLTAILFGLGFLFPVKSEKVDCLDCKRSSTIDDAWNRKKT